MGLLDKLFGAQNSSGTSGQDSVPESVTKIVATLKSLDEAKANYIAAFAYLLGRVAHADLDISEEETRAMHKIVHDFGGLSEEEVSLVVDIAKSQNVLFGGIDNYIVAREFKESSTTEQKHELLHCLFAVSASDDSISGEEEKVIDMIGKELGVHRPDLIAIRSEYNEKREVLKGMKRLQ